MNRRHLAGGLALVGVALVVTACGSPAATDTADAAKAAARPSGGTVYPAQVTSCGREVRVEKAPERIVSFFPSNTELLLRLGLKDRIAGQTWTDQSPPKPAYARDYQKVKVLAPGEIGREALLAARPDFILADGEYQFDGKKLPTIAELAKLGVPVYIDSAFCPKTTGTATLTATTTDLTALGTLLDVQPAARQATAETRERLSAVDKALTGRPATTAAMVQIVDRQLYALAGGLYSDIVRRAGGRNVLDDAVPKGSNFAPLSVEALAKKNPDVLIYHYTGAADRAASEEWLRTHLAATAAVRGHRLIAVPAADFSELRAVDGTVTLAKSLHPDAF
ncbi:ABC transporter substrate-binding protein [Streptomyces sp. MBT53]|uniref:ABC transporter substrate-binding protein n=1 Tax=Streptomyces sp. MBT53 TaxID=1488384 RepID=UPI0019122BB5|nr:ABC transporter substrate-binding protein [Streptomyces sp. MBT53]MBK6011718.1 ABC transporter substrate-binding protein [Streptomyces sp. MBT53]